MSRHVNGDKMSAYYDEEAQKVKRLVTKKLQHYFNTQKVENEFDSSGRGLHTTSPLVASLELAYLTAAEKPTQKQSSTRRTSSTADLQSNPRKRGKNAGAKNGKEEFSESVNRTDFQNDKDKDKGSRDRVSPKVVANSRIKGRFKGEEVERLARNAEDVLTKVSVEKIETVHRFRQQPVSYEDSLKGKVPHISPNVFAVLNTEAAWLYAENNEERKLAKEYKEKKNKNVKPKKKNKVYSSTSNRTEVLPVLQRTETEASEEDIKRATPEPEDSACSRDSHVTIPLQDKGSDEEVVQGDEVLHEDQQKEGEGPSEDSVADGRLGQSNGKVHDSFPAKEDYDKDPEEDPKKNECADEDGSFLTPSNKEQHENTSEDKVSKEEYYTNDQLYAEDDDVAKKKKDEKNQGTEDAIKKDTGLIVSDNISPVRKDDISNADGISIVTQSSERLPSESGMQYDYSDATWEDDENLDARKSEILGDDEERKYSYSPDPDFSDGDDKKSLDSVGTGKQQGNEIDNRSIHSDCRRGSSRTEEYTRAESVVSLTEMVRASVIEEQGESKGKELQDN